MYKSTFFTAAAVFAAGASAQLFPQNGTMTSSSTSIILGTGTSTSSSAPAPTASDPVFCPAMDGQTTEPDAMGVSYDIACDLNYGEAQIIINVAKRQVTGSSLQDCLDVCSALDQCVATAFDTNNPRCYFYSTTGDAYTANGFEFASVAARDSMSTSSAVASTGTSLPAGSASNAPYPTSNNATTSRGPTAIQSMTTTDGTSPSGTASRSSTAGSGTTGSGSTGTSSSAVSTQTSSANDFYCPSLNGQVFINGLGISFIISCGTAHFGVIIDITISKRQSIGGADDLGDCLDLCSANDACVGTAYNTVAGTCTLYSSIGAAYNDPTVQFGTRVGADVVATPGQTITVPVYQTNTVTITSCAPTVTNCPLGSVVTQTVAVDSTVYVCPSYTTYPASPIACTSCPYAAVTATAYSTTTVVVKSCAATVTNCPYNSVGVQTAGANGGSSVVTVTTTCSSGETVTTGGSTTVLSTASVMTTTVGTESGVETVVKTVVTPVATTVVNYPIPTSTGQEATGSASIVSTMVASGTAGASESGSGSTKTGSVSTQSGSATTSSGLAVFTGAAPQLAAGGVAGAVIAGLAFML